MSSRSLSALFATCAVVFAACGGAAESGPPPSNAPRSEIASEPTSVEDAQQQIARLHEEIAGPTGGASSTDSAGKRPSSTTPPAPPPPPPPTKPDSKAVQEESPSRNVDSCQSPCRAIASMRRAVTALCRMTGTDDTRCTDAKKTLAESETKLVPCGC